MRTVRRMARGLRSGGRALPKNASTAANGSEARHMAMALLAVALKDNFSEANSWTTRWKRV